MSNVPSPDLVTSITRVVAASAFVSVRIRAVYCEEDFSTKNPARLRAFVTASKTSLFLIASTALFISYHFSFAYTTPVFAFRIYFIIGICAWGVPFGTPWASFLCFSEKNFCKKRQPRVSDCLLLYIRLHYRSDFVVGFVEYHKPRFSCSYGKLRAGTETRFE